MSTIKFANTRQMDGLMDEINSVKELIENKINLSKMLKTDDIHPPKTGISVHFFLDYYTKMK